MDFNHIAVVVPRLEKALLPTTQQSTNSFIIMQCGENLCISSSQINVINLKCPLEFVEAMNFSVYKDGSFYTSEKTLMFTEVTIPESLGTYKIVLSDSCGMDTATSVSSLCGKFIYTYLSIDVSKDKHY